MNKTLLALGLGSALLLSCAREPDHEMTVKTYVDTDGNGSYEFFKIDEYSFEGNLIYVECRTEKTTDPSGKEREETKEAILRREGNRPGLKVYFQDLK